MARLNALPRGLAAVLAVFGVFASCGAAAAQERADAYPSRNILLIVPFPPGGPPDVLNRVLAQTLGEILGKPVVVENRPGASTAIATQSVARAAPDGYTLMAIDVSITVAPHILANPGFDPIKDFKPIAPTARSVLTLVVHPSVPATTATELAVLVKAKPGELKFGHSGIGTPPHLGILSFIQATNSNVVLVAYRGAALVMNDVVGGHIQGLSTAPSTSIQLAREGKIRVLAVTGSRRIAALPDVRTFKEQGIDMKGIDNGVWFGMAAPAATSDAIVAKLTAAVNKTVETPSVRERLAKVELTTQGGTPQDLAQTIAGQLAFWKSAMQAAGVKPE